MNIYTHVRMWRVGLPDGESANVSGSKVVVTDAGCLMILDDVRSAQPTRIFAASSWVDCEETTQDSNPGQRAGR